MLTRCYRISITAYFIGSLFTFLFSACNNKHTNNTAIAPPTVKEAVVAPLITADLSPAQLEKIKRIQSVFAEVFPESIEETIADFNKDKNPDGEIGIWLSMADAYEKFLAHRKGLSLEKKKEVFGLILLRSMQEEEDAKANAKLTLLDNKEAAEIFSYYQPSTATIKIATKE